MNDFTRNYVKDTQTETAKYVADYPYSGCSYRLPCGMCRITGSFCFSPGWTVTNTFTDPTTISSSQTQSGKSTTTAWNETGAQARAAAPDDRRGMFP